MIVAKKADSPPPIIISAQYPYHCFVMMFIQFCLTTKEMDSLMIFDNEVLVRLYQ